MRTDAFGEPLARPVLVTPDKGMTKQSFKKECDVNNILARYAKTGLLTPVVSRPPEFVDVSEVGDYQQALENVRSAGKLFMDLPSHIRSEFGNDPGEFLDFCTDADNEDQMREMGLLPPLEVEDPLEEAPKGADVPPAKPEVPPSSD